MWKPSSLKIISISSTTLDTSSEEYKWGNIFPSDVCSHIKWSSFKVFTFNKIKFFCNQEDLILLKVDTLKLDHLLWEQASDGNMFPHLYSALDISNIVDEFEITLSDDGSHNLPVNF